MTHSTASIISFLPNAQDWTRFNQCANRIYRYLPLRHVGRNTPFVTQRRMEIEFKEYLLRHSVFELFENVIHPLVSEAKPIFLQYWPDIIEAKRELFSHLIYF